MSALEVSPFRGVALYKLTFAYLLTTQVPQPLCHQATLNVLPPLPKKMSATFSEAVAILFPSELNDIAAIRLSCAGTVTTALFNAA